jgi:hypothetical protein
MKEEKMVFPRQDNGPTRVVGHVVTPGEHTLRGQEKAHRSTIRIYTGKEKALRCGTFG